MYSAVVSSALPPVIHSEREFAALRISRKHRVFEAGGRFWEHRVPGFIRPVHFLAQVTMKELNTARRRAWGCQAALVEAERGLANGSIPVHLLTSFESYHFSALKKQLRAQLRHGEEVAELVTISRSEALLAEGYRVYQVAVERTKQEPVVCLKAYTRDLQESIDSGLSYCIAAFSRDKGALMGYMLAHAVTDTAYLERVYVDRSESSNAINWCLLYEMVNRFSQINGIRQISLGLHSPELPGLVEFKRRVHFPVTHIPAYSKIFPPFSYLMKRRNPNQWYRSTGVAPAGLASTFVGAE